MTFDKSLPSSTTKIRNYPTVLQANFAAIEEGQSSLQQWKANFIEREAIPSTPSVNPARIDDTMQVYSKQNADGETDLYVIDDRSTANVIELTENGKLGGRSQDIVLNEAYYGTDTLAYGQWAVPTVVGSITGTTGAVGSNSEGIASCSRTATGKYTITFTASRFSNTNYAILLSALSAAGSTRAANCKGKSTTSIDIETVNLDNTLRDTDFDIVIFGGR